jgi:hypothetical protein
MVVTATAGQESEIYCAAGLPGGTVACNLVENPPPGTCPAGEVAFRCALGPLSAATPPAISNLATARRLGWSFDVKATLIRLTTAPNLCDEGQFVRTTIAGTNNGRAFVAPNRMAQPAAPPGPYNFPIGNDPNGGRFSVVNGPALVPAFDAQDVLGRRRFGSDDYAQPYEFKRHLNAENPKIRHWYDQFAADFDSQRTTSLSQQAEFVTFVRGNTGTCWCQFKFEQEVTNGQRQAIGGGRAPENLTMIAGNRCTAR